MTHSANVVFENGARAYELETQRLEAISHAQEAAAKSQAIEAKTMEQKLTNARLNTTLAEYTSSLRRFRATLAERKRTAEALRRHGANVALLRNGDKSPGIVRQNGWSSFSVLTTHARMTLFEEWQNTLLDVDKAMDPAAWAGKTIGGREVLDLKMPQLRTLLDLMRYQSESYGANNVVVRWGTYPHLQTVGALDSLDDSFKPQILEAEQSLEQLRRNEYDIWKTADLLKLGSCLFLSFSTRSSSCSA